MLSYELKKPRQLVASSKLRRPGRKMGSIRSLQILGNLVPPFLLGRPRVGDGCNSTRGERLKESSHREQPRREPDGRFANQAPKLIHSNL